MPVPQQLGRGTRMGRGPYEKSGLVEDTSLPPLRTQTFTYDVFYPAHEEEKDDVVVRTFPTNTLEVEVKLWYLPFGTMENDPFLWHEFRKKVAFQAEGR
jgi:hypothetical protein